MFLVFYCIKSMSIKAVISQVLCEEVGKVISSKMLYSGLNDTSRAGKNWKFPRYKMWNHK